MNDFLSWCRHLLVPFLFDVTSLHPLHFIEMIFPLVIILVIDFYIMYMLSHALWQHGFRFLVPRR